MNCAVRGVLDPPLVLGNVLDPMLEQVLVPENMILCCDNGSGHALGWTTASIFADAP